MYFDGLTVWHTLTLRVLVFSACGAVFRNGSMLDWANGAHRTTKMVIANGVPTLPAVVPPAKVKSAWTVGDLAAELAVEGRRHFCLVTHGFCLVLLHSSQRLLSRNPATRLVRTDLEVRRVCT